MGPKAKQDPKSLVKEIKQKNNAFTKEAELHFET